MGWATPYIESLKSGTTVKFRPVGKSMTGIIESGQLVTVRPITPDEQICRSDVVLCFVNGRQYIHLVKETEIHPKSGEIFFIGNNRGGFNGWTPRANIYGKLIAVED